MWNPQAGGSRAAGWFAVAANAGHGLTGDPVGDIAMVVRKCFLDGLKKPDGYNEADLPKNPFQMLSNGRPLAISDDRV